MNLADVYTLINKNKSLGVIKKHFNNYIISKENRLFIEERQKEYDKLGFSGTYGEFLSFLNREFSTAETELSFDDWKVTQFIYDEDIIDGYTITYNNLPDDPKPDFNTWINEQDYIWTKEDHPFQDYLNFDSTPKFDATTIDYSKYLDEAKDVRKKLLKNEHLTMLTRGKICGTSEIKLDCDANSVNNFNLYLSKRTLEGDTTSDAIICDFDNVTHQVSYTEFVELGKELGDYYNELYGRKWTKREEVDAATTVADVFKITF